MTIHEVITFIALRHKWSALESMIRLGVKFNLSCLFNPDVPEHVRNRLVKKYAGTALGGMEAAMRLPDEVRVRLLCKLYPGSVMKQCREELALMKALGLTPVEMVAAWNLNHQPPVHHTEGPRS